jgi:hypothetical protein
LTAGVSLSAAGTVERAVNEARMAAFFVIFTTLVGVGVTVGFETSAWWLGVVAAVLTAVATALVIAAVNRIGVVKRFAMELMHRITGQ